MDLPTGNIWAGNVALGFRLFLGPWELYDLYEKVTTAGSFLPQNPRGVFKEHFFHNVFKETSTKSSMTWTLFCFKPILFFTTFTCIIHPKQTQPLPSYRKNPGSSRTFVTPFPSLQISYHELRHWRSVLPFTCALIIQQPWRLGGWVVGGWMGWQKMGVEMPFLLKMLVVFKFLISFWNWIIYQESLEAIDPIWVLIHLSSLHQLRVRKLGMVIGRLIFHKLEVD